MPIQPPTRQYTNLRQVLPQEYASLAPKQIEALMEAYYGEGAAESYENYLEGFFDDVVKTVSHVANDVGKVVAKAAPVIATVGGGALQGAAAGSALGLPGIITGLAIGGTGAALNKYGGKGAAHDIGNLLSGVTGLAGQFSPLGKVGGVLGSTISGLGSGQGLNTAQLLNTATGLLGGGASGGGAGLGALASAFGGSSPASQLMSLLQRPEVGQALAALNLGPNGRRNISVGSAQTPVPASAIAGLIGHLIGQVVDESAALSDGSEGELRYMTDTSGEFIGDPAVDRDRAARVWDLLNNAQAERLVNVLALQEMMDSSYNEATSYFHDNSEAEYYDAIDLAELNALENLELEEGFGGWDENEFSEDFGEFDENEYYEEEY